MYWTFELINYLEEAPWPATKAELIEYAERICTPIELIENLQELDDETTYHSIDEVCPEPPSVSDYYFDEDDTDY